MVDINSVKRKVDSFTSIEGLRDALEEIDQLSPEDKKTLIDALEKESVDGFSQMVEVVLSFPENIIDQVKQHYARQTEALFVFSSPALICQKIKEVKGDGADSLIKTMAKAYAAMSDEDFNDVGAHVDLLHAVGKELIAQKAGPKIPNPFKKPQGPGAGM